LLSLSIQAIEEKNNTAIRGYVGYLRYDTPEQMKLELLSNVVFCY